VGFDWAVLAANKPLVPSWSLDVNSSKKSGKSYRSAIVPTSLIGSCLWSSWFQIKEWHGIIVHGASLYALSDYVLKFFRYRKAYGGADA
jgi:hypothetical protein